MRSALLSTLLLLILSAAVRAQDFVPLLPGQPLPEGYETQTLFLICNPDWLQPQRDTELAALHAYYITFGRVIGARNAAVWFWRRTPDLGDGLVDDIDVERNARLCTELGLKPSAGPHLVYNTQWDRDHFVISFGGTDATGIKKVLVALADGLVAGELDADRIREEADWQRLATRMRRVLGALGCLAGSVTAIFDAKFLKVEIDGAALAGDDCG